MVICIICNKEYSSYQSRSNHMKKYHNNIKPCITINDQNVGCSSQKNNQNDDIDNHSNCSNCSNRSNIEQILKTFNCQKCDKKFNNYQNKWRHEKSCTITVNLAKENEILKEKLKKQEEEISQIKTMLSDFINKNCKVHPKTLQKINKQLNVGDNGIINENNNINNGTVNNITYNIIGLGHENLTEVFSKKEKMNILKYRYCSLPQLVEYAHFNDKYPQFKNILITNTQNTLAYKYDTKKKQFVAVNNDELLDDIVDERMCDINSFYEELENELDGKTKDILDKVKDKIESDHGFLEPRGF